MTRDPEKLAAARKRQNEQRARKRRENPEWAKEQDRRRVARMHRGAEHVPPGQQINEVSLLTNEKTGELDASWTKTKKEPGPTVAPPPHFLLQKLTTGTFAGEQRVQWQSYSPDKVAQWDLFWAACKEATASYAGLAEPVEAPAETLSRLLTVYPLGDPHLGMLSWAPETGEHFDTKICERDLIRVVDMLVDRAPASKRGLLVNLGDFYHAESDKQLTPTGGNKVDVDGRHAKIAELGFLIERRMIHMLLRKHERVDLINIPGNHDPNKATMLACVMRAIFENEPRVHVADANNPYQYVRHGKNLIGVAHGDGAKMEQLPLIMAADRPEDWGASLYRTWITGHVHHQQRKEFVGCTAESFRTLATRDFWHHHRGYRSGQSLSCITFDEEYGEITRSTVDLRLGRAE